jgi:hypothetical protein
MPSWMAPSNSGGLFFVSNDVIKGILPPAVIRLTLEEPWNLERGGTWWNVEERGSGGGTLWGNLELGTLALTYCLYYDDQLTVNWQLAVQCPRTDCIVPSYTKYSVVYKVNYIE